MVLVHTTFNSCRSTKFTLIELIWNAAANLVKMVSLWYPLVQLMFFPVFLIVMFEISIYRTIQGFVYTLQHAHVHYKYILLLTIREKTYNIYMLFICLQRYSCTLNCCHWKSFPLISEVGVLRLNSSLILSN